jgi:hypothetical protein
MAKTLTSLGVHCTIELRPRCSLSRQLDWSEVASRAVKVFGGATVASSIGIEDGETVIRITAYPPSAETQSGWATRLSELNSWLVAEATGPGLVAAG